MHIQLTYMLASAVELLTFSSSALACILVNRICLASPIITFSSIDLQRLCESPHPPIPYSMEYYKSLGVTDRPTERPTDGHNNAGKCLHQFFQISCIVMFFFVFCFFTFVSCAIGCLTLAKRYEKAKKENYTT